MPPFSGVAIISSNSVANRRNFTIAISIPNLQTWAKHPMSATGTNLAAAPSIELITPRTIAAFLIGDAGAIKTLANNRSTIWVGLLFVMSAAIAREYDGEDLLHEPWYLLIPLAASVVTSFVLYVVITLLAWRHKVGSACPSYRAFLSVYWMTAPLAWLYGIPVERLGSEELAVKLNTLFLSIVAFWRVMLIIRAIVVQYGARIGDAIPVVMLFADCVMLTLLAFVPIPILSFMGGIKSSPSETFIALTTVFAELLGYISLLIWTLGTLAAFAQDTPWEQKDLTSLPPTKMTRRVWVLAILAIAGWCSLLPITQPEQQLRRQVETQFRSGKLQDAIAIMSRHQPQDFPPYWDPPPRVTYTLQHNTFTVADIVELMIDQPTNWVRQIYLWKLKRQLEGRRFYVTVFSRMSEDEQQKILSILDRLFDQQEFLDEPVVELILRELASHDSGLASDEVREKARSLFRRLNERETQSKDGSNDDNVKL